MRGSKDQTIFSIVFKKGMADNNRLPLGHVIATLQQVDQMVREIGKQIQRENGVENPDGDFGIELLAGRGGLIFRKGSVRTASAVTRDVKHGVEAITRVMETTDIVEKKKVVSIDQYGEQVLRRLPRVSQIQEQDKTELHFTLTQNGKITHTSKFGEKGREALRQMASSEIEVEAVTLYGKLRELKDLSKENENSNRFWGELVEDNGSKWRVCFSESDLPKVLPLFRKQVSIFGDATYFKTAAPRIDAMRIEEEKTPDYIAAFDNFQSAYADIFGDRDPEEILDTTRT